MAGRGRQLAIILGVALFLALGRALVCVPLPALYCELFPTAVRYIPGFSSATRWHPSCSQDSCRHLPAPSSSGAAGRGPVVLIIIAFSVVAMVSMTFAKETNDVELADIE